MRIQFTVSQSEWNTLEMKSIKEGYPDVPSYCKDMVLKQRTYVLRDLVDTPPSNLGVKLYAHQKELGIEIIKKDSSNTNMFKKL